MPLEAVSQIHWVFFSLPSTKDFGRFLKYSLHILIVCERKRQGWGERETENLCVNAMVCLWKSDNLWKLFLSLHHRVPRMELSVLGLVASTFPCWAISHTLSTKFYNQLMVREGSYKEEQWPICSLTMTWMKLLTSVQTVNKKTEHKQ